MSVPLRKLRGVKPGPVNSFPASELHTELAPLSPRYMTDLALQDALRDALEARTELKQVRQELREAKMLIRELEAEKTSTAEAPLRATLPSSQAPDWLLPAPPAEEAQSSTDDDREQPRLRFTAEEMPDWWVARWDTP